MKLHTKKSYDEQCTIIRLVGELSIDTADVLLREVQECRMDTHVILDLGGLTFIDSTGAGVLVLLRKQITNHDSLVLSSVSQRIKASLKLLGVLDMFKVFESTIEAIIELR